MTASLLGTCVSDMEQLLTAQNLSIQFGDMQVVKNISFSINKNEVVALVGESGSGKTVSALSVMNLLPATAKTSGSLFFNSASGNIELLLPEKSNALRGKAISMIFQEPMTSLNPVMATGKQVAEMLMHHKKMQRPAAMQETINLFKQVGIPDAAEAVKKYPHQMSGGQKQRVMIAMAISCNPALLIADEPTTALDVTVQKNIMELLMQLRKTHGLSILLITHDLALVSEYADKIIVMYKGEIVETGPATEILRHPAHNYTKALLACKPSPENKNKRLPIIEDYGGDTIATKGTTSIDYATPILEMRDVHVDFPVKKDLFGRAKTFFPALRNITLDVFKGETIGLVGESGSGKTTVGRVCLGLIKPSRGSIMLYGRNLQNLTPREQRIQRREMQIVFQDPYGSLNPRLTIGEAITEPMQVHNKLKNAGERREFAASLLEQVKLNGDALKKYPHQFSGGQRQRICIARSLALNPGFIVFDESVSALDVSVQAQVLNLISDLKSRYNFSAIFISHDLNVIHYISDRILVMRNGEIIESGLPDEILFSPKEVYTRRLIEAIPKLNF